MNFHQRRSHAWCPVRTRGGSLPCGRYLRIPLTENKKEEYVHGTPSKAYTDSVPNQDSLHPDGQHSLASCTKVAIPVGQHMISSPCKFVGSTWHVTSSGFYRYKGKIYFQDFMFFCKWSSILKMVSSGTYDADSGFLNHLQIIRLEQL